MNESGDSNTSTKPIETMGRADGLHQRAAVRFFSKVKKTETCWIWIASIDKPSGYGWFRFNKKMMKAHRFSYEFHKGSIPSDKELDHLCRNRACVNPDHLESVSHRENVLRSPITPSALCAKKTHCPQDHEYRPDNIYFEKDGKARRCKICKDLRNKIHANKNIEKHREYARKSYHKKQKKKLLSLKNQE